MVEPFNQFNLHKSAAFNSSEKLPAFDLHSFAATDWLAAWLTD